MKSLLKKIQASVIVVLMLISFTNVCAQTKNTVTDSTIKTDSVLSKVEVEASFPGGDRAWNRYVTNAIQENQSKFKKSDYGTCIIKFIVDTRGHVSKAEATTMKKSRLAKVAIEAIANGPRWHPAQQGGRFVNAYRLQPVTLTAPEK